MEEGETVSIVSRKELRKQKLMEYLAAKGKLKLPNPKPYLRDDCQVKKSMTSALKVVEEKENKAPVDTFRYRGTKDKTLAAQATKHPVTGAFNVTNKTNVKGRIPDGQQNAKCPSAASGRAQPKCHQNPVLTAWSIPVKTASARISIGPIVKTKTGLIPAVTQPRNTMRSSTSSSVTVSQRSAVAQRKTHPTTAPNNPVDERTTVSSTAKAGIKAQDQNKSNSKPLLRKYSQPSCKSQLSSRLKLVPTSKCTAAPVKPEGIAETDKSAGEPTDRSRKQKSEGGGEKNGKPSKVPSGTSLAPASRGSFRAVNGVTRAAVAELGGKTKTCKETQNRRGQSSANAPPPQKDLKKTGTAVMPKMVPRPAKTISHTGQHTDIKMSKVPVRVIPQTEGKKVTAAQEERMRKLQEWREAKGISYKRPPMPVKPQVRRTVAVPQPFWTAMKEEDEAHSLICAIDRSLADCIKLLAEGCPPDQVKEVLSRLPAVSQKFAKYWICQARLMEREGNLDVLPMFEEAVRVVLEPVDELRTVVFEILKKRDEIQASEANEQREDQIPTPESSPESGDNPTMTPKPVRALIWGERGDSAVVKYKITATPGGPPSHQSEPARVNGQEIRFFTPVRRSVRIERASLRYPASLQDHDLCVASYNDLISREDEEKSEEQKGGETSPSVDDTPMYIYRQNEALKDKVFVQLVCDSGV